MSFLLVKDLNSSSTAVCLWTLSTSCPGLVCVKHLIASMLVCWLSVEDKGSISKASNVLFWFLQRYWCLIKAECCFPTSCSSRDQSLHCLSQHQLGSIRSLDNGRWHMPAFITEQALAVSLICVCSERFVCGDQEVEELCL